MERYTVYVQDLLDGCGEAAWQISGDGLLAVTCWLEAQGWKYKVCPFGYVPQRFASGSVFAC